MVCESPKGSFTATSSTPAASPPRQQGPGEGPADAAETVDAHPYRHDASVSINGPLSCGPGLQQSLQGFRQF